MYVVEGELTTQADPKFCASQFATRFGEYEYVGPEHMVEYIISRWKDRADIAQDDEPEILHLDDQAKLDAFTANVSRVVRYERRFRPNIPRLMETVIPSYVHVVDGDLKLWKEINRRPQSPGIVAERIGTLKAYKMFDNPENKWRDVFTQVVGQRLVQEIETPEGHETKITPGVLSISNTSRPKLKPIPVAS